MNHESKRVGISVDILAILVDKIYDQKENWFIWRFIKQPMNTHTQREREKSRRGNDLTGVHSPPLEKERR